MSRLDEIRARLGEGDTTPMTEPQLVRCIVEMLDGRREDRIDFFEYAESDVAWLLARVEALEAERAETIRRIERAATYPFTANALTAFRWAAGVVRRGGKP